MATTSSTTGSTLLQPLSNAVQLPIDQVPASGASCPGRPCRLWCHPAGVGWGLGPGLLCPAPGGAGARSWPCPFACRSDWCLSAHPAPHRRPGRGWARAEAWPQPAGEG